MRSLTASSLLPLALALATQFAASPAQAANPVACRPLNAGLTDEQRPRIDQWLRQERPGGDFTVDHSCNIDGRRAVVAVADYSGLNSAAYVADFSGAAVAMRRIAEGAIETPVLFTMPGGGRSLVYVSQQPDRGLMLRAFKSVDLADGQTRTLYEAHYDSRRRGCRANSGVERVLIAVAARPSDVNRDGVADLIIDREQEDCATGKTERGELVFLATPDGFRPRR